MAHPYYALNDFAKGYVEAMFFTNGDMGRDDNENLLNEMGTERLTKASVDAIKQRCRKFTGVIMPDGCFVRQWIDRLINADETPRHGTGCNDDRRAGHFFWYASQGHGVAWTDDYSPDQADYATADGLQDACRALRECEVYVQRGWIYVS